MALNPHAWWVLDGDGTDEMGNRNPSSTVGSPTAVASQIPNPVGTNMMYFDGNDEYYYADDTVMNTYANPNGDWFAVSLWFNASTIDDTGNGDTIWSQGGGTNSLTIYVSNDLGQDEVFCTAVESSSNRIDYAHYPVNENELYHLGCIYDFANGNVSMFLNGVMVHNDTTSAIGTSLDRHTGNMAMAGQDASTDDHNGAAISGNYVGYIGEFAYWGTSDDGVPTAINMTTIYENGVGVDATLLWDASILDLGAGLITNGNLTGSTNITTNIATENVTITCDSGNCSDIVEDWTNTNDMIAETREINFTCINNTATDLWAVYNVTSANITTIDQVNVSCLFSSMITILWNESTNDLGTLYSGWNYGANSTALAAGTNTNLKITELSGNGTSFIAANMTTLVTILDTESSTVEFNCSPLASQTGGYYEALYNINSTEDPSGSNITISCTVITPYMLWDNPTAGLSVYSGSSGTIKENATAYGDNTGVTITEFSGTGTSFISPSAISSSITHTNKDEITFTCTPPDDQTPAAYNALYTVNSTYEEEDNITVTCTVAMPLIDWNDTSTDISSDLNTVDATKTLQISSTGVNNNTDITCSSGDCGTITENWIDNTNMDDLDSSTVDFTCDDGTAGSYSATFLVNSTQNVAGDSVTINCEIEQTYGFLDVTINTPSIITTTNVTQDKSFWINTTVNCIGSTGALCGKVHGIVRDNRTSLFGDGSYGEVNI
ncbi:hypothetical protein N9934_05475, partial [Desulfosarcina sp.]|nr:hypothetical protein [Desulfosarcina sp.]